MTNYDALTRRQLLGGLVTVGAGSAATGAGTAAYFSDTESSTENHISTGTLVLGFDGTETFDFAASLAPGDITEGTVTLVSPGSISGSLDVDFEYTNSDARNNSKKTAKEVAEKLVVTKLSYSDSKPLEQITDASPTLHDLATNDLTDLPDPDDGTPFTVGFELQNVGNQFKKEGVAITVTFHLNQNGSQ